MLSLSGVTAYNGSTPIFTDLSCQFPSRAVSGIFGVNGIGKTSLLQCMIHAKRYSGEILFDNKPIDTAAGSVALVESEPCFHEGLTGSQNIKMICPKLKTESIPLVAPSLLKRKVATYSHGERIRFALGVAIALKPSLLLLDEPSLGLDPEGQSTLRKIIRGAAKRATVIVVDHNPDFIRDIADHVFEFTGDGIREVSGRRARREA